MREAKKRSEIPTTLPLRLIMWQAIFVSRGFFLSHTESVWVCIQDCNFSWNRVPTNHPSIKGYLSYLIAIEDVFYGPALLYVFAFPNTLIEFIFSANLLPTLCRLVFPLIFLAWSHSAAKLFSNGCWHQQVLLWTHFQMHFCVSVGNERLLHPLRQQFQLPCFLTPRWLLLFCIGCFKCMCTFWLNFFLSTSQMLLTAEAVNTTR